MTVRTRLIIVGLLALVAGGASADYRNLEDYFSADSLVLQVRYCDCEAVKPDAPPDGLQAGFLTSSESISVGLSPDVEGFVASDGFALGYLAEPVEDQPQAYRVTYSGERGGTSAQGIVILSVGQWTHLFGVEHRDNNSLKHSNVAVRLVEPGDR